MKNHNSLTISLGNTDQKPVDMITIRSVSSIADGIFGINDIITAIAIGMWSIMQEILGFVAYFLVK